MRKLSNFQPSRGNQLKSWGACRSPAFAVVALAATAICAATTDAQRVKKGFDRKTAEIRTARLHDAKWGVFNHFLQSGCKTAEEWNAKVDGFDVEKVASQLESCGAKFYFITMMFWRSTRCATAKT